MIQPTTRQLHRLAGLATRYLTSGFVIGIAGFGQAVIASDSDGDGFCEAFLQLDVTQQADGGDRLRLDQAGRVSPLLAKVSRDQVRSSIARRLGLDVGGLVPVGRDVEGVVEMMTDATVNYEQPLTAERLFEWPEACHVSPS